MAQLALGPEVFAQAVGDAELDLMSVRRDAPERDGDLEWGILTGVDHRWPTIPLARRYADLIVVAGPVSNEGVDPGVLRVTNMRGDAFELRFQEWAHLDDVQGAPERAIYLVAERGLQSVGGRVMEASSHETDRMLRDGLGVRRGVRRSSFTTGRLTSVSPSRRRTPGSLLLAMSSGWSVQYERSTFRTWRERPPASASLKISSKPSTSARLRSGLRGVSSSSHQVTVAEIEFALRSLPASRRRHALEAQWSTIAAELIRLPWSDEVSRRFGERKARLERAGRRMSDFDLVIAVHALAYGLTLVTADRAFERLKLSCENWLD